MHIAGASLRRLVTSALVLIWAAALLSPSPASRRACAAFATPMAPALGLRSAMGHHSLRRIASRRVGLSESVVTTVSASTDTSTSSSSSVSPTRPRVRWPWTRRKGHDNDGDSACIGTESSNATISGGLQPCNSSATSSVSPSIDELFPFTADGRREFEIARSLASLNASELTQRGWSHALTSGPFNVYTHADATDPSLLRFLVIGKIDGASPRSSMYSFINGDCRVKWDAALKSLLCIPAGESSAGTGPGSMDASLPGSFSHHWPSCREGFDDILYYRAKFPWPMKDRDYYMSRRCRVFEGNSAKGKGLQKSSKNVAGTDEFVGAVVSAVASEGADIDVPAGTMRMHRYRGITAFLAADEGMNNIDTPSSSISSASAAAGAGLSPMDRNGTVYVALSVDDQVQGSKAVVSMLNSVAARLVPEYLDKMFAVARDVEAKRNGTEAIN